MYKNKPSLGESLIIILAIIVCALIFRAQVFGATTRAFTLPTDSMAPAVRKGDRVFADISVYQASEPKRGDIIVFKYPQDRQRDFLRRVVPSVARRWKSETAMFTLTAHWSMMIN